MERLFFGTITGCFLAIITINTHGILSTQNKAVKTSSNSDSDKCFLVGRRECQIIMTAIPSSSTAEGGRSTLPTAIGVVFAKTGSTSKRVVEVAND